MGGTTAEKFIGQVIDKVADKSRWLVLRLFNHAVSTVQLMAHRKG